MHVYFLVFALAGLAAYLTRSRRNSLLLALLFALFLLLFVGTRFDVGCDFWSYVDRFQDLYTGVGWSHAAFQVEGGFHLLNVLVRDAGFTYRALLVVCAAIYVGSLWRFALLAPRPLAWLALAFPILVLQLGMSGLRQSLATGVLMLGLVSFTRHQPLRVAIFILLASSFHASALIFLPIVMLARRDVSATRLLIAIVLVSPLVAWLIGERIDIYQQRYIEQVYGENAAGGAWFRYAMAVIPFVAFEWKRRLIVESFPDLGPLLRLFSLITFGLVIVGALSSVALHRATFYVLPVSILAALCVAESVFSQRSSRIGQALPYLAYTAYIAGWLTLSGHSASCYLPYGSWLL